MITYFFIKIEYPSAAAEDPSNPILKEEHHGREKSVREIG